MSSGRADAVSPQALGGVDRAIHPENAILVESRPPVEVCPQPWNVPASRRHKLAVSAGAVQQLGWRGWHDSPYGAPDNLSAGVRYDALANFEAPGGAAFRVALIPSPVRVCSYLPDLWGWQRQAVLLGLNSDVHEWAFPTAALPARRCPAATDGEPIALSGCPEALADLTSGKCASKGPLSLPFLEGGCGFRGIRNYRETSI